MKKLSHLTMLLPAFLALTSFSPAQQQRQPEGQQQDQDKLVQIVRSATQQYQDVSNAVGYSPVLGCVSGSDHGAMGIHYVNSSLVNGPIDPTNPQALIYEPQSNGELQAGWRRVHYPRERPSAHSPNRSEVEGHLMKYVDGPSSRPKLPRTVTAYRPSTNSTFGRGADNPKGPFADWNDHVSCAGQ